MKRISCLLMITIVCTLMIGCSPKVAPVTNIHQVDSVHTIVQVLTRDTNIIAPPAAARLQVKLDRVHEDMKPVSVVDKQAKIKLSITNRGELLAECECDTLAIRASLKDTNTLTKSEKAITKYPPPELIKYVPWYVKILAWVGGLVLIYVGIHFALKGIKK